MILNGYCNVQKKNCSIDVDIIGANCLEDIKRDKYVVGRITCEYASNSGKCAGSNCSVMEQNGVKR